MTTSCPDPIGRIAQSCRFQLEDIRSGMESDVYSMVHRHLSLAIQECIRLERYHKPAGPTK